MALTQVTAGNRIITTDVNQFYNILKGVSGSGESITLLYNSTGVLILQPSSDPAAGTEAIQIKNNAGTVQGSLTFDGKVKTADGTAALPSHRFESEATGFYLSAAGIIGVSASGATTNILMRLNAISVGASPAASGNIRVPNNALIAARNAANGNDIGLVYVDASDNLNIGAGGVAPTKIVLASISDHPTATLIALGAGAAPTVGTIGGAGPAVAGQNAWWKIKINAIDSYIPIWR